MPNTATALLNEAGKHVGVKGRPNAFTRAYSKRHGDDFLRAAWCDMFVTECARNSGARAAIPAGDRAYTVYHANDFANISRWYSGTTQNIKEKAAPGDVVFFDWDGGNTRGVIDHVGIVKKNLGDGRIITVEGNTSDMVALRVRGASVIAGFGKPKWDISAPVMPVGNKYPGKLVKKGWENSANVKKIQSRLNTLGYKPKLITDGDFGTKTEVAVKWFQGKNSLDKDGIVGPATWAKLFPPS